MKNKIRLCLGLFALTAFALASCKKEKDETPVPVKSGQVRYTAGGQAFEHDSLLNYSSSSFTADTLTFGSTWITPNDPNKRQIAIGISILPQNGVAPTPQEIWDLFEPGPKPYARAGQQPNGAVVEWWGRESATQSYYANSKSGIQPNGTFVVTERAAFPDFLPVFEVAGTFSCTVYDGGQHPPTVIKGEWRGIVPLY